jgi:hypothetical protein
MPKKSTVVKRRIEVKKATCFDRIFFLLSLILCLLVGDAYAYIDPGTGSYIFQLAIAGILAAAYILKVYWIKVIDLFKSLFLKAPKGKN